MAAKLSPPATILARWQPFSPMSRHIVIAAAIYSGSLRFSYGSGSLDPYLDFTDLDPDATHVIELSTHK
jgi:hypothetical protein